MVKFNRFRKDSGDSYKFQVFLTLDSLGSFNKSSLLDNTIKPKMPIWTDVTNNCEKEKNSALNSMLKSSFSYEP